MSLTRRPLRTARTVLFMTLLSAASVAACHGRSVVNPTPCVLPAFSEPPAPEFHPCTPVGVESLEMACIEPPLLAALAGWVASVEDYVTAVRACPLVTERPQPEGW